MNKFLTCIVGLLFFSTVIGQTLVPDPNFEQFLVDQGIDSNGITGDILDADAEAVTVLSVTRNDITDFTGLEAFINLVNLNAGTNQFATLPLNNLTLLEELRFRNNQALASLDLSQNTALRIFEIRASSAAPIPTIPSLDFSQNLNLEELDISVFASITSLTFPVTPTLTDIDIAQLSVPTIDMSLLTGDIDFRIVGSRVDVTILYPNQRDAMKRLELSSIDFPLVDVSELIGLERLGLFATNVESFILPNTNTLTNITIWNHEIAAPFSMAAVPQLQSLDIRNNFGTFPFDIDLTTNTELRSLTLPRNLMNSIDISQNIMLTTLDVNTNNLTTLDVTNQPDLNRLDAYTNQLPSIDLSQNLNLQWLNLSQNELPALDVTLNTELRSVNINSNQFTGTGLDLTQNLELSSFSAAFNEIESLDITQNTELSFLVLNDNLFPGTAILDQFYAHQLNRGRLNIFLNVENNLLSGRMPDFFGLYDPAIQTRRSSLRFGGNAFEFGDFEEEHLDYVALLTTMSIGPSPDFVFREYTYAPQAKVNAVENFTRNAGETITITTVVRGAQNHYRWFKDGIEIPEAPDAPELVITDLNTCDAGVYHTEITSDLVPFENADPPGTDGKNLLLVRNDITLTVNAVKDCVVLDMPLTDVPINSGIQWADNPGACGYRISIGTASGSDDLLPLTDVGEVTVYNHSMDYPANQDIYVTIIPYYDDGDFAGCPEQTFRTSAIRVVPECTLLISPLNGSANVAANLSRIEWNPANGADEYNITLSSPSGANDITTTTTDTFLTLVGAFMEGEEVTVTIVPLNTEGNAGACMPESFTIVSAATPMPPSCSALIAPADGATDVAVDLSEISWTAVTGADGYRLTINGSTSDLNDETSLVVTGTTHAFANDFENGETVTVTIVPFNGDGDAMGCTPESFTIVSAAAPMPPSCSALIAPADGTTDVAVDLPEISWGAAAGADGYRLTINGSMSDLNDETSLVVTGTTHAFANNFDNGETVTVTIVPFNADGDAVGCTPESFTIVSAAAPMPPSCSALIAPADGATDVAVDLPEISWTAVTGADGYRLTINGSTSDLNDEVSLVVTGTTHAFANDFENGETVTVTIVPFNADGDAVGCTPESFTIVSAATPMPPSCSALIAPADGATDVAVDLPEISWTAVTGADGYRLTINGSVSDLNDETSLVVTGTTHAFANDFENGETVTVTIVPFNADGDAVGCTPENFTIISAAAPMPPSCSALIAPADGATDVAVDLPEISWTAVTGADGYRLTINGSTSDLNDETSLVVMGTTHAFANDFENGETVTVTIVPFNADGDAVGCTPESFTIISAATPMPPSCSALIAPADGATDVAVDLSEISWGAASGADGYRLTINGSTSDLNDEISLVVTGTTHAFTNDFENGETVTVTIVPFNADGDAVGCTPETFTIVRATVGMLPSCTTLTTPADGATDVAVDTQFIWEVVPEAEGYFLAIGTSETTTDILGVTDVSLLTSFNLSESLPFGEEIFVTIVPYNAAGNAGGCTITSFTTVAEPLPPVPPQVETFFGFSPDGDGINEFWEINGIENYPNNRVTIFNRWGDAVFKIAGYDNNANAFRGEANQLTSFGAGRLPEGTYFFKIDIPEDHNLKTTQGYLVLKR
ncbi:T9SS type B sorting domain-containing protein [Spongiimicrobium salis]|uniref:T9SS type B sorting domain-containing protein n=1 Tax=Spongiimicrobium salis TaxID=1667022 RepID=UPI00374D9AD9